MDFRAVPTVRYFLFFIQFVRLNCKEKNHTLIYKEYGVRWYKDQSEICMSDKFRFKDKQRKHKLIITDIQAEDSGVYSCECGTAKTSCKLYASC
jgi:hypothetical protein